MEVLRDNDLPVLASCGGTASCATCHVFLDKEIFDSLGERSQDETEILADAEGFREYGSRLSCQVEYSPALDGITVNWPRRAEPRRGIPPAAGQSAAPPACAA